MADNINYNEQTQKHSFMSVKEKAWHGLGQVIDQYPNSSEALKFAGLDYTVEKRPLFTYDTDNNAGNTDLIIPEIDVPNYFATVRTDTEDVLGVVGTNYQIVQNTDAFRFFDSIVGGDGVQYETAGALGKGERIFITAKLPDYIRVGNDDLIEKYLFLTTSHNGFGSITAAFTPIRIVCQNTLNAALNNCSNSIKIRHTQSAKERLEQAHAVMGISNQMSSRLDEIFNRWSKIKIDDPELLQLIQLAMAPDKETLTALQLRRWDDLSDRFVNNCDTVFSYALSNETQQTETTRGTVFGAYNAVTGYFQNVRSYKNAEAKLDSLMFGGIAAQRTQRAFDLCRLFSFKGREALHLN